MRTLYFRRKLNSTEPLRGRTCTLMMFCAIASFPSNKRKKKIDFKLSQQYNNTMYQVGVSPIFSYTRFSALKLYTL